MSILSSKNIAQAFHRRVEVNPARAAWFRRAYDSWKTLSWREVEEDVFNIHLVLRAAGIKKGDRVALLANNQPRWSQIDYAVLSLGAVTVPIYSSLTSDDVFYILNDSAAKAVFVEDPVQWFKVKGALGKLSSLKNVWSMSPSPDQEAPFLEDEIKSEREKIDSLVDEMIQWRALSETVDSNDLASIVYTSGTTGFPKGVPLSHNNFMSACKGALAVIEVGEDDRNLFFLPPAHVLGRVEQFLGLYAGWSTAYCENLNSLADYFVEIEPTFMVSVPRIFEKIYAAIVSRFQAGMPFGRYVFQQALRVAQEYSKCLEARRKPGPLLSRQFAFFDRILFAKVKKKFGGKFRFAVVGGAPMSESVSRFFHASGILVLEGYGLTETSGPVCMNTPLNFKLGTVGKLFFENRIRIGEDGEILLKGPSVFTDYHGKKGDQESFTADDFFFTGDVGGLDHEGFLKILDRKKDIIVSSGGKNIAPQKIERYMAQEPLISQAMVVGGDDKVLGVLLSVNLKQARKVFRADSDKTHANFDEWLKSSAFLKILWKSVHSANTRLSPFERVKKLRILPRDLSIEAGELTPSLKIRRAFCEAKFSALIEDMYTKL